MHLKNTFLGAEKTQEYRKDTRVISFGVLRRKEKQRDREQTQMRHQEREREIVHQMIANCTMIADGGLALLSLCP